MEDKNLNYYTHKHKYNNERYYEQIRLDYLNEEDDYESESFIVDEICAYCGIHMGNVNEIFVDIERDTYICQECGIKHGVRIVRCKGLE